MTLTQQVLAKLGEHRSYIIGLSRGTLTKADEQCLVYIHALKNKAEKHGITATGLKEHEYCYECQHMPPYPCMFIVELAKDLGIEVGDSGEQV